ncbi:hypothetical protein ACYOEI_29355 [Singulisphaera rosea]
MRPFLVILGFIAAALIITQLTLGMLITASHAPKIVTAHKHTGYLTVVVSLVYILGSLMAIASMPRQTKS